MSTSSTDQVSFAYAVDPDNTTDPDLGVSDYTVDSDPSVNVNGTLIVRIQVENTGDKATGNDAWQLYYNTTANPATASQATTTGTTVKVVDDGGSNDIADGAACDTARCASNGNTWQNGEYRDNSDDTGKLQLAASGYTEFAWHVQFLSSGTIYLYMRQADTVLNAHTSVMAVTVSAGVTVTPSAEALTLAVQAPTIKIDDTVTPAAEALTLSVQAPTVRQGPAAEALTLSVQAPTIQVDDTVTPAAEALTLSVLAPTVDTGGPITVQPDAQALTGSVLSPTPAVLQSPVMPGALIREYVTPGRFHPQGLPALDREHPLFNAIRAYYLFNDAGGDITTPCLRYGFDQGLEIQGSGNPGRYYNSIFGLNARIDYPSDSTYFEAAKTGQPLDLSGSEITFVAMVRLQTAKTSTRFICGFPEGTGSPYNQWYLRTQNTTGYPYILIANSSDNVETVEGSADIHDLEWHQIAGSWDGTNLRLYIDGVEDANSPQSGGFTGDISSNAEDFHIGASRAPTWGLDGWFDHFILFEQVLTAAQIRSLSDDPFQLCRWESRYIETAYPTSRLGLSVLAPTIQIDDAVTPAAQALTLSVLAPTVITSGSKTVQPAAEALTLSTQAPTVEARQDPAAEALTLSIQAPTVEARQDPAAEALTLSVQAPTVQVDDTVTPAAEALTLSVLAPTVDVSGSATVQPAAEALTLSVQAPTVQVDDTVTPAAEALTLSRQGPAAEALTLSVQAPTIQVDDTVTPAAEALTLSVLAPTVDVSGSVTVQPAAEALTLSVPAPTIQVDAVVTPAAQALTASVTAPTIQVDAVVTPAAQALTASVTAPTPAVLQAPSAEALTLTAQATTVQVDGVVTPAAQALTAAVLSPTIAIAGAVSTAAVAFRIARTNK
jgi:hypothetical protein